MVLTILHDGGCVGQISCSAKHESAACLICSQPACARTNFLRPAKLKIVKVFRLYLLVLLTVLMPLRGAMAHVQSCASGNGNMVVQATAQANHELSHADSHRMNHADHGHDHLLASSGGATDTDPTQSHGHQGKCSSCTLTCASACVALPSSMGMTVMQAVSPKFPSLTTLTSQFLAEGPERPPRSL